MNTTVKQIMTNKMSWRAINNINNPSPALRKKHVAVSKNSQASNQVEFYKSSQDFNDDTMMDNIDDTSQATSPALRKKRVEGLKSSQASSDDAITPHARGCLSTIKF